MNKSLPHVCTKCRVLKMAELGEIRTRPGSHAKRYFICLACIGKKNPLARGRPQQRRASPDEREAIRGAVASGFLFRREYAVESFFFDLAFPALRLLVEVDSLSYHSGRRRLARDHVKQKVAERAGWKVVRVRRPDVTAQVRAAVDLRQVELFDHQPPAEIPTV